MHRQYRSYLQHIVTALALLWLSACTAPVIVRPQLPVPSGGTATATAPAPESQPADRSQTTRQIQPVTGNITLPAVTSQPSNVPELLYRAANSPTPQRQILQLQAVALLIRNRQQAQATALLQQIDTTQTTVSLQAQKKLYQSELALARNKSRRASRLLRSIFAMPGLSPDILGHAYQVQNQLHIASGNLLQAAIDLIQRSTSLSNPELIRSNEQQIWQLLNRIAVTELQQARAQETTTLVAGWLDLSLAQLLAIQQSTTPLPALRKWQNQYPDHPAAQRLLFDLAPALDQQIPDLKPPRKIALLLPLSSDFAAEAKIIQDSILDASQSPFAGKAPQIEVYDIGDDPTLAGLYYRQAVRQGADWVIGPLGKRAVQALVTTTDLTAPTLLLAVLATDVATNYNTFQIGLPPEQEAQRLAERAQHDGHQSAVALYPDTAWGKRLIESWRQQWLQLGGKIAAEAAYNPKRSDQSGVLKKLLGIYGSELRMRRLQGILQTRLKFLPRRRQDIDHIVLFAHAAAGRLIKPQLNFFQAIDMPVYSTSAIYAGYPDKIHDIDLNGIRFADMPWMLSRQGVVAATRQDLQDSNKKSPNRDNRLYALGIDAYRILPHLSYLRLQPDRVFNGISATMRMDKNRRLQRYPLWAVFIDGQAVVDPADITLGVYTGANRNGVTPPDLNNQPGAMIREIKIGNTGNNNSNWSPGGTDRWQPPAVPGTDNSAPKLSDPNG